MLTGLFVGNNFVLAEGSYEDKVFRVDAIGFPPPETSTEARNYFESINFFGGSSATCAKGYTQGDMFVFASDVFLDDRKVMDKLATLFRGYSDDPPTAFVLMGNFSSAPYGPLRNQELKETFKALADLILQFPSVVDKSQFFFIPGPQDPGPGNI